jgi:enoyl-CoA hydratase/carnithine racemase
MSEILSTQNKEVLTLTFNRPEKMNALTRSMYSGLAKGLNDAAGDFGVRAVVITSAGDHFTAGNDINDFMNNPPTSDDSEVAQFLAALLNFPKPLIASVNGNAVIAGPAAKFSMPFASLGLVPEAGSSYLFPQLVGYQRAARIFMTGESFDADEAIEMGLVTAKDSDPLAHALKIAELIAEQPPQAIINTKALLKARNHDSVAAVMKAEFEIFAMALQSDEAMEAFMKFMSKKGK